MPHASHGSYRLALRDPCDRMAATQSAIDDPRLIRRDPAFAQFRTRLFWQTVPGRQHVSACAFV